MTITKDAGQVKHTQGPWHVPGPPMAPDNFVVTTKDGDSICDCSPAGPWVSIEEAEANARMCAAAPDLLKALEFYADEKNWKAGSVFDMESGNFDGWSMARAALSSSRSDQQ